MYVKACSKVDILRASLFNKQLKNMSKTCRKLALLSIILCNCIKYVRILTSFKCFQCPKVCNKRKKYKHYSKETKS